MRHINHPSSRRGALSAAAAISLVLGLAALLLSPLTTLGAEAPDVNGDWQWSGTTTILAPGDPGLLAFFGVKSEGPVLRLVCHAWGILTLVQSESSFTGYATQDSECTTQGGQTAISPFPTSFGLTGSISGHSVFMDGDGGPGITCSWQGSLTAQDGVATQFHTVGGCDVPVPFHPSMTRDLNFDAVRD